MGEGSFRGIENLAITWAVITIIFVPLGVWKIIEMLIWLYRNVEVSVK